MPEKVDMAFFTTNLAQCNSNTQWRGGKPYHLSLTILTLFSSVSPVIYVTFLDDWGECWVISVVGHFQYYMYQDQFPWNCRLLFVFVLYFSLLDKLVLTVWKTADTMQCRYTCNHALPNKVLVLFHFYKIQTLLCFRQQSKTEEDVYAKVFSHSTWLKGFFCLCQNTGRKRRTERTQSGRGLANKVGRSKIYWRLLDTSSREIRITRTSRFWGLQGF